MRFWRTLGVLVLLALMAGGFAYYRATRRYQGFSGTVYVELPHGTSTNGMATELAKAGVIGSRWDFWIARIATRGRALQAGEYAFDRPASPMEVCARITRGDIFYLELKVPEGKNMFDIAAAAEQLGAFKAEDFVKDNNLLGEAAEKVFDRQAEEILVTVNEYLTVIADVVRKHDGTLDKFIGDCVMAFWGAPTHNPHHAISCVRAAIETQRAVYALNLKREAENRQREAHNLLLAAEGKQLVPLLPILVVGTGVNTGDVTVGLMGSDESANYTVFGREVNLASRLETVSGRARIIISESTLAEIIQDDSTLALSCKALPPEKVKGIREAVPIYEVPWRGEGETGPLQPQVSSTEVYNTGYFTAADRKD